MQLGIASHAVLIPWHRQGHTQHQYTSCLFTGFCRHSNRAPLESGFLSSNVLCRIKKRGYCTEQNRVVMDSAGKTLSLIVFSRQGYFCPSHEVPNGTSMDGLARSISSLVRGRLRGTVNLASQLSRSRTIRFLTSTKLNDDSRNMDVDSNAASEVSWLRSKPGRFRCHVFSFLRQDQNNPSCPPFHHPPVSFNPPVRTSH